MTVSHAEDQRLRATVVPSITLFENDCQLVRLLKISPQHRKTIRFDTAPPKGEDVGVLLSRDFKGTLLVSFALACRNFFTFCCRRVVLISLHGGNGVGRPYQVGMQWFARQITARA